MGGTRNCDWWFTNEAILLDTAGRYTTQSEDRDEWIAFLEQMKVFRPEKPLNGVMVAVSVPELLDSTEEQIEDIGRKVRGHVEGLVAGVHVEDGGRRVARSEFDHDEHGDDHAEEDWDHRHQAAENVRIHAAR